MDDRICLPWLTKSGVYCGRDTQPSRPLGTMTSDLAYVANFIYGDASECS